MLVGVESLKTMSQDPLRAMDIGKAAEHLVCAHLILSGYRAYLSDQGLPYDVVVDAGGRLLKVQVKSCSFSKDINPGGVTRVIRYKYIIQKCGKRGRKVLQRSECDIVALVALDCLQICYMAYASCPWSCSFIGPGVRDSNVLSRAMRFDEFPFQAALDRVIAGNVEPLQTRRGKLIECDGQHKTASEWSRITGLSIGLIYKRLVAGWSTAEAIKTPVDITRIRKLTRTITAAEIEKRRATHREWWARKRAAIVPSDDQRTPPL